MDEHNEESGWGGFGDPNEEKPTKNEVTLRPGERPNNCYIRLTTGEIVKTESIRIMAQSLNIYRSGNFEYAALRSGMCCPLPLLEEFAGTTTDELALQNAANNYAPPDVYDPQGFPDPKPTGFPVTTVEGTQVKIFEKISDEDKATSFERLKDAEGNVYVSMDIGNKVVRREIHKKLKPQMYLKPNEADEGSPSTHDKAPEGGI